MPRGHLVPEKVLSKTDTFIQPVSDYWLREMNKVISLLTIFGGLFFLGTGFIFIIAGGSENVMIGLASTGIGLFMVFVSYLLVKAEASKPRLVHQDIHMSGSGEMRTRDIQCPACGAGVAEENIKLIEGGLMVKCPYCEKVTTIEEAPKW